MDLVLIHAETRGDKGGQLVVVEGFDALVVFHAGLDVVVAALDIAALVAHVGAVFAMAVERHFTSAAGTFHGAGLPFMMDDTILSLFREKCKREVIGIP